MKYRVRKVMIVEGEDIFHDLPSSTLKKVLKISYPMICTMRSGKYIPSEEAYLKYKKKMDKYLTTIK